MNILQQDNFAMQKVLTRSVFMKKAFYYASGLIAGIINGLIGTGGGIIMVMILKKLGLEQKKAHATSICIILPICLLSSIIYLSKNAVSINQATPYIIPGTIGAIFGAFILSKINQKLLRKVFGIFMLWAASQLLLK